ncbi:hypothetical protein ACFLQ9_01805 [Bacteroidota bacterium]
MKNPFVRSRILYFILILFVCSCATVKKQATVQQELIIYPSPPSTPRIQYLTSISNSNDITGQQSNFSKFIMGEEISKSIVRPYGIDIKNGKIYICDPGVGGMEIINLEEKTFVYFGPKGLGLLPSPVNCYVDDKEFLYVVDGVRKQIVVFDKELNFVKTVGDKKKLVPVDIFEYDEKFFVTNSVAHQINVYKKDSANELLLSFPEAEAGDEQFLYQPTYLTVLDDFLYVTDFGDFRIKKFSHNGEFLGSIGSSGNSIGQFARPKGNAVDKDGNLYALDAGFENVQIFNEKGQVLMFFGGPYQGHGDMYLPTNILIDYDNLKYFEKHVDPSFNLKYLIFVTNQFGPDKISIYGFIESKVAD